MRQFLTGHWEKLVALVVAGICAWALVGTARLLAGSSAGSDDETIEAVRTALKTNRPSKDNYVYAVNPRNYSKDAESGLACIGYAKIEMGPVSPHLIYPLAPKTRGAFITKEYVRPSFGPPVLESVHAGRGRITVVVSQNPEDEFIRILRFEIFRKEADKPYGEKPVAVLEGAVSRARRAEKKEGGPTLHEKAAVFATATHEDREVEPKTSYTYRARAIGVDDVPRPEEAAEKKPEGRPESPVHMVGLRRPEVRKKKRIEVIRPVGVEEMKQDGTVTWLTPFSGEQSGQTPTNVELTLMGVMGEDPDWRARIKIRQWNRKIDDWDEGDFSIEEGDPVEGRRTIRRTSGQERVKFDSGYVLLKIERVLEKIVRMKKVPVPRPEGGFDIREEPVEIEVRVAQATVKEVSSNRVEVLRPLTEREGAASEEEAPATERRAPANSGGRRRRRTKPEGE